MKDYFTQAYSLEKCELSITYRDVSLTVYRVAEYIDKISLNTCPTAHIVRIRIFSNYWRSLLDYLWKQVTDQATKYIKP